MVIATEDREAIVITGWASDWYRFTKTNPRRNTTIGVASAIGIATRRRDEGTIGEGVTLWRPLQVAHACCALHLSRIVLHSREWQWQLQRPHTLHNLTCPGGVVTVAFCLFLTK